MSDNLASPFIAWPAEGVVRIRHEPSALPHLGDEPGTNRFDDPRPAASSLRGCLLELLAGFRPNPEASERESAVETDDPDFVEPPDGAEWQHIADFLAGRKVASVASAGLAIVSINDPTVQHELDKEPAVRAVLDTEAAQTALLEAKGRRVHLDNAAIRLSSPTGRYITQACALALHDRQVRPDVIHYRSRHDDSEDCWAIYDHADVQIGAAEELSPSIEAHAAALRSVAHLWDLPIPPAWTN